MKGLENMKKTLKILLEYVNAFDYRKIILSDKEKELHKFIIDSYNINGYDIADLLSSDLLNNGFTIHYKNEDCITLKAVKGYREIYINIDFNIEDIYSLRVYNYFLLGIVHRYQQKL